MEIFIIVSIFIILAPVFWWFIVNLLGKLAGLDKNIDRSGCGIFIRETGYGSSRINRVNFNGSIKILYYEKGFMLKVMPIFGGFEKWFPRESYKVQKGSFFLFGKSTIIQH